MIVWECRLLHSLNHPGLNAPAVMPPKIYMCAFFLPHRVSYTNFYIMLYIVFSEDLQPLGRGPACTAPVTGETTE